MKQKHDKDNGGSQQTLAGIKTLLDGDRTEAEQLALVCNLLVILIDVLRSMTSNRYVVDFLSGFVKGINAGKKLRFSVQAIDR